MRSLRLMIAGGLLLLAPAHARAEDGPCECTQIGTHTTYAPGIGGGTLRLFVDVINACGTTATIQFHAQSKSHSGSSAAQCAVINDYNTSGTFTVPDFGIQSYLAQVMFAPPGGACPPEGVLSINADVMVTLDDFVLEHQQVPCKLPPPGMQ